ncbi:MAG: DUF616 domain-containing protein [Lachnospiraceae bacterium]|nr:DUF616 domain-containing protein [Lachnospiraceae bacterium]
MCGYGIEKTKKIALICAGLHGILFYEILKICGIKVDCFIDNSKDKWGKVIVDDIQCVAPSILMENKHIVYVCVGKKHYISVTEEIISKYHIKVCTITEFIDALVDKNKELYFKVLQQYGNLQSADVIYDINANRSFIFKNQNLVIHNKIALYSAVFGNYDSVHYSKCNVKNVDMFFISDDKPKDLPIYYKWIDAKCIIPKDIVSPIKRNRYVKMNPHKFLSVYDYSIYIDGNIVINNAIDRLIKHSNSGISVYMHPVRECIYHEAISIVNFKRVNADDVCRQMKRYMEEGMPSHYGLGEMSIIAREHNKVVCISVMETWWKEFDNEAQRDQLSFMYALWKNKLSVTDLGCLGYDVRNDNNISFFEHVSENRNIKNEKLHLADKEL